MLQSAGKCQIRRIGAQEQSVEIRYLSYRGGGLTLKACALSRQPEIGGISKMRASSMPFKPSLA